MTEYEGKNVVITGGTSGVGFATAKLFVDGGARVLITGRTRATLDSARERLGDSAVAVRADAASLSDVDALVERAKAEFGRVDLLFVNAGVTGAAVRRLRRGREGGGLPGSRRHLHHRRRVPGGRRCVPALILFEWTGDPRVGAG
ncbi:SDR family NAD(P)-dependent oxidoreductase [Amycolatopsis sp. cmx-4-68]|uniref:SDR family NAD(P)-dependent oxidoreductase n=1 Tax=Amycolatopsis sp. cmx-4-68 TaxID=2790938 RepID=UPI00397D59CB